MTDFSDPSLAPVDATPVFTLEQVTERLLDLEQRVNELDGVDRVVRQ